MANIRFRSNFIDVEPVVDLTRSEANVFFQKEGVVNSEVDARVAAEHWLGGMRLFSLAGGVPLTKR